MPWQASGSSKRAANKDSTTDDASFPGLKPTTPDATAKIEYEELQKNELLALEAIYGDDFVMHTSAHSAWKVSMLTLSSPDTLLYTRARVQPLTLMQKLTVATSLFAEDGTVI